MKRSKVRLCYREDFMVLAVLALYFVNLMVKMCHFVITKPSYLIINSYKQPLVHKYFRNRPLYPVYNQLRVNLTYS